MISYKQLNELANMRLEDAKILYDKQRYNAAFYLCGYANEFELKAMICKKLKLYGIPNKKKEFAKVQNVLKEIMVHNPEKLLELLGILDPDIPKDFIAKNQSDWSIILEWYPETRYSPIDEQSSEEQQLTADNLIKSTTVLLNYFQKNIWS